MEVAKHLYYTDCPLINRTMCGTDNEEMELRAGVAQRRFRWDGIRRAPGRYDACYYIIKAQSPLLKSGSIQIKMNAYVNTEIYISDKENKAPVQTYSNGAPEANSGSN